MMPRPIRHHLPPPEIHLDRLLRPLRRAHLVFQMMGMVRFMLFSLRTPPAPKTAASITPMTKDRTPGLRPLKYTLKPLERGHIGVLAATFIIEAARNWPISTAAITTKLP